MLESVIFKQNVQIFTNSLHKTKMPGSIMNFDPGLDTIYVRDQIEWTFNFFFKNINFSPA